MHQKLTLNRLQDLLERTTQLNVAVFGDFSLDQVWTCHAPTEDADESTSVTQVRYALGGAGRIVELLSAIGVRAIRPFGIVGNDGYGWQLLKMLQPLRCDLDDLAVAENWMTPVSVTCSNREQGQKTTVLQQYEMRSPVPINKVRITEVLQHFAVLASHVDLVIVYDAFPEPDAGVFSSYLRGVLSEVAGRARGTPFVIDSSHFVNQYSNMTTKITANQILASDSPEGRRAKNKKQKSKIHVYEELQAAAMKLRRQTLKPVLVSLGEKGILTCDGSTSVIPALPITPPVDRSAVGQCITAFAAAALASDATPIEAAQMGMLAANVVMHQRSFPTLATRNQLIERFQAINHLSAAKS